MHMVLEWDFQQAHVCNALGVYILLVIGCILVSAMDRAYIGRDVMQY